MSIPRVDSPDDPALDQLLATLAEMAPSLDKAEAWPAEQLRLCAEAGVFRWFLSPEWGGLGWSEGDLLRAYVKLASACLTTTFVVTQAVGAMQRIAAGNSQSARDEWLPEFLDGRAFATVGISHLTTSRQHLDRPVLRAAEQREGFVLDGYSPWVTGAEFAECVVVGATLTDGRQILVALPTELLGVRIQPAPELVALSASRTGPVYLDNVQVDRTALLAGPVHDVMKQGLGARTGGSQTSALALGLATAAIEYLTSELAGRANLAEPTAALVEERDSLLAAMLSMTGEPVDIGPASCALDNNQLRAAANSLALRASQAALAAAKGAGFVRGHPAGRWCREALFFLVWSCPQPVLEANLCELAGIAE